ncbi:MAG: hypothetical protein H0V17_08530, partial [Deltaproteobacteria bacterium]|nr:hypothetical protein [Deltaproteobacteria bacterium]
MIAAELAGMLTAAIPPRLIKKLDATPTLAEAWTWTATSVTTDKGETVTFVVVDDVITALSCSCLLAPKCLHVAAVVTLLEPAEGAVAAVVTAVDAPVSAEPVSGDSIAAAKRAFRAGSDVLAGGAEAAGAFAQAELLRAIHACRTAGLHRLAGGQTRMLRSIRELRSDRPEFALETLTADLRDVLTVSHALSAGDTRPELIGTARRDYASAGNLRLRGVLTEAIVARSGYAGAATYLIDDKGRMYTRSDVAPGDAGRAAGAYDASAGIGDAVLPHRELCRTGLFVSDATASADGRLGAGQKVRAVRASEPSRWDAEPLASRFSRPIRDQLAAIADWDAEPDDERPAGWDFLYLDGIVVGGPGGVGIVAQDHILVRLTTPLEQRALAVRDNLVILARSTGLAVRAIGRVRVGSPRQVEILALGPAPTETRLVLPEAWHGRANLAYDRLSIAPLGEPPPLEVAPAPPSDDLLSPLRRRVERAVLGGAGTLPTHAIGELDREAAQLADRALRGGAETLRDLAALAHDAGRGATGVR